VYPSGDDVQYDDDDLDGCEAGKVLRVGQLAQEKAGDPHDANPLVPVRKQSCSETETKYKLLFFYQREYVTGDWCHLVCLFVLYNMCNADLMLNSNMNTD
jgi:hypothetical protein